MIADLFHSWLRRFALVAAITVTSGALTAPASAANAAPESMTQTAVSDKAHTATMTGVAGARPGSVSDWSGDGFADILAVSATGNLYYYPNNGLQLGAAVQIGSGFQAFKHLKAADFSGDGQADVIGITHAGEMLYYPKNGTQLTGPIKFPGSWVNVSHLMVADWSCDGHADVLAVIGETLFYYPNNNNSINVGYAISPASINWDLPRHVVAGDWSGDGCADIIDQRFIAAPAAYDTVYFPHTGAGLGGAVNLYWAGEEDKFLRSMDFSGDGHADLIRVFADGEMHYLANNGGHVTNSYQIGAGFGTFIHLL